MTHRPATLRLDGVVDESTFAILTSALARVSEEGNYPVRVDLAGVEFCDVAGLRAIVAQADGTEAGHPGAEKIILTHVPPPLATLLGVLGWDATPGLILADPGPGTPAPGHPAAAHPGPGAPGS